MDGAKRERPICWLVSAERNVVPAASLQQLPSIAGRLTRPILPLDDGGAILSLSSGPLTIMPIMQPMPVSVVVDDRLQAAAWPNWRQAAAEWRSHVIISMLSTTESPGGCRENITNVLRASVEFGALFGANGLGWEGSRLFIPFVLAQKLLKQASLPCEFLVRIESNATGIITRGLRSFNLPEVRDMTKGLSLREASIRLWNLAAYLIQNGWIAEDGDTIGIDERRSARIRHTSLPDGQLLLELHSC